MAFLASSYIIFTALAQSIFYIQHPQNVAYANICFKEYFVNDIKYLSNCSESSTKDWFALTAGLIKKDGQMVYVFKTELLPENFKQEIGIHYKLKFVFSNGSVGVHKEWKLLILNEHKLEQMLSSGLSSPSTTASTVTPNSIEEKSNVTNILNNFNDTYFTCIAKFNNVWYSAFVFTFFIVLLLLILLYYINYKIYIGIRNK